MSLLVILLLSYLGALISHALRLPVVVGYIAMGIVSSAILGSSLDRAFLSTISQVGVVLLMFALGIEFSFVKLTAVLRAVWLPTLLQIFLSTALGLLVFLLIGVSLVGSLVLAFALSLSSTAIVVKSLSERGELDSVPGELTTGWLIMQDLTVIPALIFLPLINRLGESSLSLVIIIQELSLGLFKSVLVLAVTYFLARFIIPRLFALSARAKSSEIFLLTAVVVVFLFSTFTSYFGLSLSIGAFLSGLLIADTFVNHQVFSQIHPLRDIFGIIFFTSLGLALPVGFLFSNLIIILLLVLVLLFSKLILVYFLASLNHHPKTAFFTAVYLLPVSEFAFILGGVARVLGMISLENYQLLLGIIFLSLFLSSPLIPLVSRLYLRLRPLFFRLPSFYSLNSPGVMPEDADAGLPLRDHVVLCGYGRVGKYIGRALLFAKIPYVVVDYDPETIFRLRAEGITTLYGDPSEKDVLDYAQVDHARAVVIAIPDRHTQELIIAHSLTLNRRVKIFCRTHHEADQKHLKSLGVEEVVQPEFEASLTIVRRLLPFFGVGKEEIPDKISRLKIEHGTM